MNLIRLGESLYVSPETYATQTLLKVAQCLMSLTIYAVDL